MQPQYQWIAEHQMVKSQVGVITNVRPDHLEEMGPTEEDVALSCVIRSQWMVSSLREKSKN